MKEITKKFKDGEIRYRYPNIIEAMRLVGKMGVTEDGSSKSEIEMFANLLESLEPFITELKIDGKKLEWDEAVYDMRVATPLSEIGTEILNSINQTGEKRAKRKKS